MGSKSSNASEHKTKEGMPIEWHTSTPNADKFALRGNFVSKVYGDEFAYQLVGQAPLPKGSTTLKATIKKYHG